MVIRIAMNQKELYEGRIAGIPEQLLGKMAQGFELSDQEKEIVKKRGKVYVLGHSKDRGQTLIKPQLRDLPGGKVIMPRLTVEEKREIEEELEEQYMGYYDDELEGKILEATDELKDLGLFEERDVELFDLNSDLIAVLINYLKEKDD